MTSYLYQFTINLYSITGTTFRLLVNNFTVLLDVEFYYFTTRGMLSILMIVSVSLCICISKQPHVKNFVIFSAQATMSFDLVIRRQYNILCTVVLWMLPLFHTMGHCVYKTAIFGEEQVCE